MKKLENEKRVLGNDELNNVTGGDYGDKGKDNKSESPMYHLNQYVEVWTTVVHWGSRGTNGGYITDIFWDYSEKCHYYHVEFINEALKNKYKRSYWNANAIQH